MHDFDYVEPDSLRDVCEISNQWGENARLIAGGTALMLALRQRLVSPMCLISVARVAELRGIHSVSYTHLTLPTTSRV